MLLGLLYVTMVMNALAFPTRQFIPAIGSEYLGVGAGLVGLLAAAESFGQLAGAGVIACTRRLQYHGRVFVGGSVIVLLMIMLFVWAPWYVLAFALLALGGCGQAGFSTMQSTITMLVTPPAHAGQDDGPPERLHRCVDTPGHARDRGAGYDLHRPARHSGQRPGGPPPARAGRGADAAGLATYIPTSPHEP